MKPINRSLARIAAASALVAAGTLAITNQAGAGSATQVNSEQFSYSGEAEEFVVPADVCSVTVDAYGASGTEEGIFQEVGLAPAGKGSPFAPPGLGGRATADIEVTPGETLHVVVGGMGEPDGFGGFNGGGDAGEPDNEGPYGGGGGGASDVRRSPYGLTERLVVAGGGGGGGAEAEGEDDGEGGDGGGEVGLDGAASADDGTPGGGGGTQTAGGAADTTFDPTAQPGALGIGGNGGGGTDQNDGGGGGGGGFYGGGGGAGDGEDTDDGGGGGGGSGFGPAGVVFETGVQEGDGVVELTWTVEPGCDDQPTTTTTAAPAAAAATVAPRFTG
jgi:hypothetical protein